MLGTERMMDFAEWEQEPLLRRCFGLDKLPDRPTLQYDLHRFTTAKQTESLRAVNPELLRAGCWPGKNPSSSTWTAPC